MSFTLVYLTINKRIFDVAVSAFLLLLLSPIFIIIALLSYYECKNWKTILFLQPRVGLHGRLFKMLKFRSMVIDAAEKGEYYTFRNDPRITKLGRFLRKYSLDELPQLINVLKGEMSLVGPRPDLPVQRQFYTEEEWNLRCSVRPGMTGLAQATLRSQATPEQRKYCDLEYAKKPNLGLDLKIILMTINQVFRIGSY